MKTNADINQAMKLLSEGQYNKAKEIFQGLMFTENSDVYHNLGLIEFMLGNSDEAIILINKAIKFQYNKIYLESLEKIHNASKNNYFNNQVSPVFNHNKINKSFELQVINLISKNELDKAFNLVNDNKEVYGSSFFYKVMGVINHRLGKIDESIINFKLAFELEPNNVEILGNYGAALTDKGLYEESKKILYLGYKLSSKNKILLNNLIVYHLRKKEFDLAYKFCVEILEIDNFDPRILAITAEVLYDLGEWKKSLKYHRKAIKSSNNNIIYRIRYALSLIPNVYLNSKESLIGRALYYKKMTEIYSDILSEDYLIDDLIMAISARMPYYIAYSTNNNIKLIEIYGNICIAIMEKFKLKNIIEKRLNNKIISKKVKLGIISSDIKYHSVWNAFLKGIVTFINKEKFDIYLYSINTERDNETLVAMNSTKFFFDGKKSLEEWINLIESHSLDIIFYPEIGMNPLINQIAAYKPAKKQVTSWGHPETSGLATMDFYLSTNFLETHLSHKNYVEKIVKLDGIGTCFLPPSLVAAKFNLLKFGIPEGSKILLCLGAANKFLPEYDYIYECLINNNDCHLIFMHDTSGMSKILEKRLIARFINNNNKNKIHFIPFLTREGFNGIMRLSTVLVDTVGFSGFNTAMQAIGNNLPVVTYPNQYMRSRNAYAINKLLKLDELIAQSKDEFISIIEKLLNNSDYLESIKNKISLNENILYNDRNAIDQIETFLLRISEGK